MPIVIGAKPESDFRDPIGLLSDCHRRVERFLATLTRVGTETQDGRLAREQRAALETALRYFREAAPKHTADEEQSLFPRLRSLNHREIGTLLERLETLERDHEKAEQNHAEIERLGQAWLAAGSLPAPAVTRFSQVVAELTEMYKSHIGTEERDVFPAAAKLLDAAQRAAMGAEMAERRGLRAVRK
jgi:hemerythrin-like domain-containing protein